MNLIESFLQQFPDVRHCLPEKSVIYFQETFVVPDNQIFKVCSTLNRSPIFSFNYLISLTALDYLSHFEVVYHLESISNKAIWVLKVQLAREAEAGSEILPEIHSVSTIWAAANWHEREAYDLLGVRFVGHPSLERLLMPQDWVGFPLRKDYHNPVSYHGITTAS